MYKKQLRHTRPFKKEMGNKGYACRAAIELRRYTKAPKEGLEAVSNPGVGVTLVMLVRRIEGCGERKDTKGRVI